MSKNRRQFLFGAGMAAGVMAVSGESTAQCQPISSSVIIVKDYHTLKSLNPLPCVNQVIKVTDIGVAGEFIVRSGNQVENEGTILKFNDTGSLYAERIFAGSVKLPWFSSVEGVTENEAFANALSLKKDIDLCGGSYEIGSHSIPNIAIFSGELRLLPNSRLSIEYGAQFYDVDIDAEENSVNVAALYVSGGRFVFDNCAIRNIGSESAYSAQYGIIILLQKGIQFSIENSIFENITNEGDGVAAEYGFCGGIYFFGSAGSLDDYSSSPSGGNVDGCVFRNIYTTLDLGEEDFDADAIRFYIHEWEDGFDVNFPININNCSFVNIQKSCIKNNGSNGMRVRNMHVVAKNTGMRMLAVIRIQTAYDCVVDGLSFDGDVVYLYVLSGKRIQILNTNTTYNSRINQGVYLHERTDNSFNVLVRGGQFNGVDRLLGSNYSESFGVEVIKISDIVAQSPTPQNPYISLKRMRNVELSNIVFETSEPVDAISLDNSQNVNIDNCRLVTARRIISMDSNDIDEIDLCVRHCYMEVIAMGIGLRAISLLAVAGDQLSPSGVVIENCEMRRYSFSAATNDEFVLVQAKNVELSSLRLFIKQSNGNNYSSPHAVYLLNCQNVRLRDVSHYADFTFNPGWAGWAALLKGCTNGSVYGVHGAVRRGVEFISSSNCHYNNIAAVSSQIAVSTYDSPSVVGGSDVVSLI